MMDIAETAEAVSEQALDGHLDELTRDKLVLWFWWPSEPTKRMTVEVLINGAHVASFIADQYRPDLVDAGIGDGCYSLHIDIKALTSPYDDQSDLAIEIFTAGQQRTLLGSRHLTKDDLDMQSVGERKIARLRSFIAPTIATLPKKMSARSFAHQPPVPDPAYSRLFERAKLSGLDGESTAHPAVSEYANFTRFRLKADSRYQIELGETEVSSFFKWYLEAYCAWRSEYRTPLASYEIDYLNEMVVIGGQRFQLSRVTYMFLLDHPQLLSSINLNNEDFYLSAVYWWSIERARSMFVEDCLVPKAYRDALVSVRHELSKSHYPLSRFMEFFFSRQPQYHFLDLGLKEERVLFYTVLMLHALTTPMYLQYLPPAWLHRMTVVSDDGDTLFKRTCEVLFGADLSVFRDHTYEELVRAADFDLYACQSLYISEKRDRCFSAALPRPEPSAKPAHVQIIGPLRLASGLGQASRLSANALSHTTLSHSAYPFDMDNPAPLGYATEASLSKLVSPAINLIHLNAESIPLAFSYLPDVFSESYNIGYFFWELNTPAKCHLLALDLVDEIWVSSQYGVAIYSPYTQKPVINVGMPIEEIEPVPQAEAKQFLRQKTGIAPDEFTFMAAFDSYSFIQRKNPLAVVRAFKNAFKGGERVRLLLKTHNKDFVLDPVQLRVWRAISAEAEADPRIVILNETLSYKDLIRLKCGCDAYVSLHRSEGWGFGMAEAMNLGIPVIATAYSGNMEFCTPETCWLVDYDLQHLGTDDYIFVTPGQQWAEPRQRHAEEQMRHVYNQPSERQRRAAAAEALIKRDFTPNAVGLRYEVRLREILAPRDLQFGKRPRKTKVTSLKSIAL